MYMMDLHIIVPSCVQYDTLYHQWHMEYHTLMSSADQLPCYGKIKSIMQSMSQNMCPANPYKWILQNPHSHPDYAVSLFRFWWKSQHRIVNKFWKVNNRRREAPRCPNLRSNVINAGFASRLAHLMAELLIWLSPRAQAKQSGRAISTETWIYNHDSRKFARVQVTP